MLIQSQGGPVRQIVEVLRNSDHRDSEASRVDAARKQSSIQWNDRVLGRVDRLYAWRCLCKSCLAVWVTRGNFDHVGDDLQI